MAEIDDILAAVAPLEKRGARMALATIVSIEGSTYRRPGARLLVPERGASIGTISGGCLEGDVERIGREVISDGTPRLELFDLRGDDDAIWGYGLGCNGAIEILIEPTDGALAWAEAVRTTRDAGRPCSVAVVVASSSPSLLPGARAFVGADGFGGDAHVALRELAAAGLAARRGGVRLLPLPDGEARVFVELIEPPPRLLVCGAGPDAIPLVRLAAELGWRTTVTDVRPRLLTDDRFPEAHGLLRAPPGEAVATFLAEAPDADSYVVVMSHNYLKDLEYLRAALDAPVAYLGMLGPRRRTQSLLRELDRSDAIDRLHAPAGLDIGGEGPDQVALAIVGEMLAVRRGRPAGFLRDRRAPIHAPAPGA